MRCAECPHLAALVQNPSPAWLMAHGWTAGKLAQALGVSRSSTSRWLKSGRIPASAKYDVGRLVLGVVHGEGGCHADC